MCGRYTLYEVDDLPDRFEVDPAELAALKDELKERYNISPTQLLPTITADSDKRHVQIMRWGYMPHWAKDPKSVFKYKTFNARSEEIFDKPTWKGAIRYHRCLVPSNGFYEWKAVADGKQPYFIHPKDQELFAFAGLFGTWRDVEGMEWSTFSIITTTPNAEMADIHTRMPVILHPGDEDRWLDPTNDNPNDIADLMRPYEDGMLEIWPVSREVNTSRVDNATLIGPLNSK